MDPDCAVCDDLWKQYQAALMAHVRISGKFKLELLIGDPESIERARVMMLNAEAERLAAREAHRAHQTCHATANPQIYSHALSDETKSET